MLPLQDIWYLFHCWLNLCLTMNKRQICPLLSCHYPMSLLCPKKCLLWMGQKLNILVFVKCCSLSQKWDKKGTEMLFSPLNLYFLQFFSEWVDKRYVEISLKQLQNLHQVNFDPRVHEMKQFFQKAVILCPFYIFRDSELILIVYNVFYHFSHAAFHTSIFDPALDTMCFNI